MRERLTLHRVLTIIASCVFVFSLIVGLDWSWIERYSADILSALWKTLLLLSITVVCGFVLSVLLALAQLSRFKPLAWLSKSFCTLIRGTPLLLQLWLLYYGLGSLFPYIPEIRQSWLWPYLIEVWPYAFVALTLSFAGYEGEVMRGALKGVPKGELEAAYALGMSRWMVLRLIWLPRAIQRVLPTLNGEVILQMKATPLVATISFVDIFAVFSRIRQETYIIYEPLILLALVYLVIAGIITLGFSMLERRYNQATG
ncbi:ABC transporter permease subunit [Vibrio sp. 404]|uniref:Arginine ABC transporter permease protein ArtM n=1 Tax=Vibrio marinisediminis TaxID=2758441 RepID=A0A7W2FRZ8_9VIBR|nr:ABC transporter permease subunit [Vibrio marinisediminis]MBA5763196.1 ABC transporter permease subunit [Vibrio marinisediminis]